MGIAAKTSFSRKIAEGSLALLVSFVLCSCTHTYHFSYTKKSGIEQLLISKAVDEAVQGIALDLKGAKLFVEVASLMRDEEPYIKKALVHKFLQTGVSVAEYPWEADYTASVLVKVAGTDGDESTFGIPSVPFPLGASGATSSITPSINLFSKMTQQGRAEMEVVLYSQKSGLKETVPALRGRSYFKKYLIFFIPFTKKDIP